jgi:hypothetical protein
MPLSDSGMIDEIAAKMPSGWQNYWQDGQPPKASVLAICQDTITMWATAILTPGFGAPDVAPPTPWPHNHTISTPFVPVTVAVTALGYTGSKTSTFFTTVAAQIATFLSGAQIATSDGVIAHNHTIGPLGVPPVQSPIAAYAGGTASAMASSIVGALASAGIAGADMPDQGNQNSMDIMFTAICEGMLEHIDSNATLSLAFGSAHIHTLS